VSVDGPETHAGDEGRLTDERFWDSFWDSVVIPARPDPDAAFDRCFSRVLERYLRPDPGHRLVEIGCAPGRWMVHGHERFGYQVCGIESSPGGAATTRHNLEATGTPGQVIEADFLTSELPWGTFDVVLSLGFVEHFTNPAPVVARHIDLLTDGGWLFLEVPNLRGVNLALLRHLRSPLLEVHNLELMDRAAFRSLTAGPALEAVELGYLGGYEPDLFDLSTSSMALRIPMGLARRARRWRRLDQVNAPWLSGYLYGVFRKTGPARTSPGDADPRRTSEPG
jgi:SAM-dependent methyltransferase